MATIEQALKQSKFPSEQVKATLNLLYTAHWLQTKISSALKPYNLTHEQFNVLRILKGSHPRSMCQKDILGRMLAPSSNLTLIVKKLIHKGLIHVEQSPADKREYVIEITPAGKKLLEEIDKDFKSSKKIQHKLSASQAYQLNALLDTMRDI
jgi:DNA-binding MarR family transcriptional regulator